MSKPGQIVLQDYKIRKGACFLKFDNGKTLVLYPHRIDGLIFGLERAELFSHDKREAVLTASKEREYWSANGFSQNDLAQYLGYSRAMGITRLQEFMKTGNEMDWLGHYGFLWEVTSGAPVLSLIKNLERSSFPIASKMSKSTRN